MKRYSRKAERVLVFLFLLFLPTQLGKHFWPEWSRVMGVRVDYLSPTVYFLDVLWCLVFAIDKKRRKRLTGWSWLILLAINVMVAEYRWVAIYRWLRILQMWWMVVYLKEKKGWVKENLKTIIPVWIIVESLLGLGQIAKGGSLNGLFYWLGERSFSYSSIGVAQVALWGRGLVRAYGTFSHPNSMAGFLLVAVLLWINYKPRIGRSRTGSRVWWWLVWWSGIVGVVLAGSRTVWLTTLILSMLIFGKNSKKVWGVGLMLIGMFILVMAGVGVNYMVGDFLGGWDRAGWSKRVGLNWAAIKMVKDNLFWGTGAGNFLVRLPFYQKEVGSYWLQPVHNIGLLILSEWGLLGGVWLGSMFRRWGKNIRMGVVEKLVVVAVLATGMMDHYWVTLPQNNWFLVVFLAMLLR